MNSSQGFRVIVESATSRRGSKNTMAELWKSLGLAGGQECYPPSLPNLNEDRAFLEISKNTFYL